MMVSDRHRSLRILLCAGLEYYGIPGTRDPIYYFFHDTLEGMGHRVDATDTVPFGTVAEGREAFNERILASVRKCGYEAVIVAPYGDELLPPVLDEMRKYTVTIAWNSDDDRRWESYSSRYAPHYSLVYTTYPDVYEANRGAFPNLRLSQWACLGRFRGLDRPKDIPFSFCGQAYGERLRQLYGLRRRAALQFFGRGTRVVTGADWPDRVLRAAARRIETYSGVRLLPDAFLSFEQVNEIWCRSRLSLALQRASVGSRLQIKSRTFEMGLSGTAMLSELSPYLDRYYDPGTEFVPFATLEECADLARHFLAHEAERRRIAEAYYRRTEAEHLWTHRLSRLLSDADLC